MNVFVNGLCLHGNKGGPAIALSLIGQVRKHFPDAQFVFAVPGNASYPEELRWARRYGVEVVRRVLGNELGLRKVLSRRFASRALRIARMKSRMRRADVLLEMSAISYVGPPACPEQSALRAPRLAFVQMAQRIAKPYFAWTQSYGPFSTPRIRDLAKGDLGRLAVVCCRGHESAREVEGLLPETRALCFPDVAVMLPCNLPWARQYLEDLLGDPHGRPLVTVSPSAMLYSQTVGAGANNQHVQQMGALCKALVHRGYNVLLVPHAYYPNSSSPRTCDYALCQLIRSETIGCGHVWMVEDDLSPIDLKSVIGNASVHIGGRYHSVIAALSTAVPCVALSWHHKYRDIMEMYGSEQSVCDAVRVASHEPIVEMVETLALNRPAVVRELQHHQGRLAAEVEENTELFVQWYRGLKR